ncbi:hypothetical protein OHA40_31710 [Nocardia sp. NBC_00508]|uniref:hypothetical protein n=1 Tax=Nocardia sp. NBC_00508 TaxID=2975992 RepID=UPI002E7FE4B6|nr:hypothetical protein [Nocardia sp. NBC_00508]WUD66089.1 hypothetical protein OHA40_31710 [Nocardia sp. NBC_00508]
MRIVAGVVGAAAGALWSMCAYVALSSRFSADPARDPHGYGLISGTMLAVFAGVVCALTLPCAFPRKGRRRAIRIATPACVITSMLLLAALFTA